MSQPDDVTHQATRLAFAARMQRAEAVAFAGAIVEMLEPACDRIAIAGSVRRGELEVGDVEIVCVPRLQRDMFGDVDDSQPHEVQLALEAEGATPRTNKLGHRIAWGPRFLAAELDGRPLDVFCVLPPASWGTTMAIRTGPKGWSKWLVTLALQRGYKFRDGHLERASGAVVDTPEEIDVFRALGLTYVDPAERYAP